MKVSFTKAHGAGNDFIILAYPESPDEFFSQYAPALCDRRKGIGADGVLLVRKEPGYDFRMVYFNSDGSRADFCGNGARALVLFAWGKGIAGKEMVFRSDVGKHKGIISNGEPWVSLPDPKDIRLDLEIEGLHTPLHLLNSGVPHAVVLTDNLENLDVENLGSRIRNHPHFAPAGTNADFVEVHKDGSISVRTFERGVDAETLACGTGAVAVAAVLNLLQGMKPPIELCFPGGILKVDFKANHGMTDVMLGGQTAITFTGEIELD